MMAQTNHDDFDDELLSAYVDGELTAAERALVEERLRSDPAAAALVEELRSLSSTIKSLPRETLGRDLRAGVLAEVDQARADLDQHGPTTLPTAPVDRWAGIRRGLVWSALAIAATVLIAVFQPAEVDQDERELARAEKREAEVEKLERRERRLSTVGDAKKESLADETDKLSEGAIAVDEKALPPGLRGVMSSGGAEGSFDAEGKEKSMAAVPASAPAPEAAPLAADAAPAEPLMFDALEQDASMAAAPAESPTNGALAKDAAADLLASDDVLALQDSPAKPQAELELMMPLASSLPEGEAPPPSGAPTGMGLGGGGAFGPRGGGILGMSGEAGAVEESRQAGRAIHEPVAKVTLKLAKADGAMRFQKLLAESDIAPADDAVGPEEMAESLADRFASSETFDQFAGEAKRDAADERQRSHYYFFSELSPEATDADVNAGFGIKFESVRGGKQALANHVWVEATPAQLDALLTKCRNAKDAFAAVEADDDLPLANREASAESGVKLKRYMQEQEEEKKSALESVADASETRERVLFVLEPPNESTPTEAAGTAPAK
jgi:hypothetical protein